MIFYDNFLMIFWLFYSFLFIIWLLLPTIRFNDWINIIHIIFYYFNLILFFTLWLLLLLFDLMIKFKLYYLCFFYVLFMVLLYCFA